jgi:hypothetical protein
MHGGLISAGRQPASVQWTRVYMKSHPTRYSRTLGVVRFSSLETSLRGHRKFLDPT